MPRGDADTGLIMNPSRASPTVETTTPQLRGMEVAMRSKNLGWYSVALAIVVVGLLWAGLPPASLVWFALVLACPLMMFLMMRGMHGGDNHDDHGGPPPTDQHDHHDSLR
jgi:hypothetical protein